MKIITKTDAISPIERSAYKRIVVLTGAGISVASGIRPFRGPDGLWNDKKLVRLSHIDALRKKPEAVWQFWGQMRVVCAQALPNPAHLALAKFEAQLAQEQSYFLVTQNIDSLHSKAGSTRVVELHGSLRRSCCLNTRCSLQAYDDAEPHADSVPHCPICGAALRPDIVMFGETLGDAGWTAQKAVLDCDLFIAIGTSGTVWPAAEYVMKAAMNGARTVYVNLEPMDPPVPWFREVYLGKAEEILPVLLGVD